MILNKIFIFKYESGDCFYFFKVCSFGIIVRVRIVEIINLVMEFVEIMVVRSFWILLLKIFLKR